MHVSMFFSNLVNCFILQENADKLAHEVSLVVYAQAGGVGDKPSPA